jgi:anti-sigma regulatory factor (Ser/Thr protein kinase)
MATVEMSFTPLPVHVRTARLVATAVARRSGVPEALLDEVRLAVGEACSRAVEAHREHCPAEPVRIELTGADGRFEVVVTDAAARDDDQSGAGPGSENGHPGSAGRISGALAGDSLADSGLAHEGLAHEGLAHEGLAGEGLAGEGLAGDGAAVAFSVDGRSDDPDALLPQGLGLAVIAGLADDVKISRTAAGLSIRMSWPSGEYTG